MKPKKGESRERSNTNIWLIAGLISPQKYKETHAWIMSKINNTSDSDENNTQEK